MPATLLTLGLRLGKCTIIPIRCHRAWQGAPCLILQMLSLALRVMAHHRMALSFLQSRIKKVLMLISISNCPTVYSVFQVLSPAISVLVFCCHCSFCDLFFLVCLYNSKIFFKKADYARPIETVWCSPLFVPYLLPPRSFIPIISSATLHSTTLYFPSHARISR